MATTVLVPPNADIGPNDYDPAPSQAHYLNVREEPHDGETTYLSTLGMSREVYGLDLANIPDGSLIQSLRIRSVQKETAAGPNTYRVGFVIGGVDYFQASHVQGAGSAFVTENDEVAVDPSTGAAWTKARLALASLVHEQVSITAGLPRPHLTECVVLADVIPLPERPSATNDAVIGSALGIGIAPDAGSSVSDKRSGDPIPIAPNSVPVSLDPTGTPSAP